MAILMIGLAPQAWADKYRTYDEVRIALAQLAQANPGIASYIPSIGTTIEGRAIPAIKISKNPADDDPNKADVLFLGGHHAREWIGVEVPLRLAEYLVANYGADPTVSRVGWVGGDHPTNPHP